MFGRDGVPKERLEFLRGVQLFEGLPDKVLKRLDGHLDDVDVAAGERLTFQGAHGLETFIVVEGSAEVTVDGARIAEVGPGEVVGEIAVVGRRARTATVTALTPMKLLVISAQEIGWLFDEESIEARIRAQLAQHLGRAEPLEE